MQWGPALLVLDRGGQHMPTFNTEDEFRMAYINVFNLNGGFRQASNDLEQIQISFTYNLANI